MGEMGGGRAGGRPVRPLERLRTRFSRPNGVTRLMQDAWFVPLPIPKAFSRAFDCLLVPARLEEVDVPRLVLVLVLGWGLLVARTGSAGGPNPEPTSHAFSSSSLPAILSVPSLEIARACWGGSRPEIPAPLPFAYRW